MRISTHGLKLKSKGGILVETDSFSLTNVSENLIFKFLDTELNLFNVDEISRLYLSVLKSYIDPYETITFEMKEVRLIDSSAVAFLVRSHLLARRNKKRFLLKNLSEGIRKTLEYANLLKDFEVE